MKWLSTNADEHLLVDDAGRRTEYSIRTDPVTRVQRCYDGTRKIFEHMVLHRCLRECEERYAAERGEGKDSPNYHGKTRQKVREMNQ